MLRGNFNNSGGQQVNWDDFSTLQDQVFKAIELQYLGSGAFILQGCTVTGSAGNYAISSGLVYIDGKVLLFDAVSSITAFPRYIKQAPPVQQDSFALEQGGSAFKRTLYKAELVTTAPVSGEFITMTTSGGRNYNDVLQGQFVRLLGNQTINGQKTFSSTIVGSVNGNAATVSDGVYLSSNQTITGVKTFNSTIVGSINGNAASVTDGVYLSSNQTITGVKTFSNTIVGSINGNAATVTDGVYLSSNQTITGVKTFSNAINGNLNGNASTATLASAVSDGVYLSNIQTITGAKTFTKNIIAPDGINTDNIVLKTKTINIGDWNMDATTTVNIAHGVDFRKIRSISVIVRDDADNTYSDFLHQATQGSFTQPSGYISTFNATNIVLGRVLATSNGWFDGTAYDSTGYNRGWVTITYTV